MHRPPRARLGRVATAVLLVAIGTTPLVPGPAGASDTSGFCRAVAAFNAARPPTPKAAIGALEKLAQASPTDVQKALRVIVAAAKKADATTVLLQAGLARTPSSAPVTVAGSTVVRASNQSCHVAVTFAGAVPTGISVRKVRPLVWVRAVCASLAAWGTSLRDAGLNLATPGSGLTTTLPTERSLVQQFVGTAATRTDQLLAELDAAGTPATSRGVAYTTFVHDGVAKAHQAFVAAEPVAATLANDVRTFQTQAQALVQRLDTTGKSVETLIRDADAQIGDRVLAQSFTTEPTCVGIA